MGLQILGNNLKRQRIVNPCVLRSQACVLWLFLKGLGSQIAERPGVALVGKQRGRMGDDS
jgi:hypothetical protein